MRRVEVRSKVPASPDAVWRRVASPEGINDELRPWLRMTIPPGLRGRTIDEVETGRALGRSRLLLFGVVPVDYDDLCLAEIDPGPAGVVRRLFSHRHTRLAAHFGGR